MDRMPQNALLLLGNINRLNVSYIYSYQPTDWSARLQRGMGRVLPPAGHAPARTGYPSGAAADAGAPAAVNPPARSPVTVHRSGN